MEAMAEANADAKEIDDAVRIGGDVALGVDDIVDETEIEAELAELIREAEGTAQDEKEERDLKELRSRMEVLRTPSGDVESAQKVEDRVPEAVA